MARASPSLARTPSPGRTVESHPGWFTHRDDIQAALRLCAGGRLNLEEMVEETHSPEECAAVYERLAFDRNFPIAVQFDWRKMK